MFSPISVVKGKVVRLVFVSSKGACPGSISHCRQKTHLEERRVEKLERIVLY